jgi:co-chaperonin GroES (HSP10)
MERIKEIGEVIIGEGEVLVEMIEQKRKSGIILPENGMSESQTNNYGIIVAVGASVKDVGAGDIVIRTRVQEASAYEYKGKTLAMFSRYNLAIVVKAANFENNEELAV